MVRPSHHHLTIYCSFSRLRRNGAAQQNYWRDVLISIYINKETFDEVSFLEISKREQNSMDDAFLIYTANICHLKCVDTEMKWDGKLANQSGMLNAFTWLNQDSAVDREVHSKSDFIRVRFCKTLSERHLRALDKIFFSLVWKKIWYYGITSSFSLSPVSIYVTVLPPWELNTAEIFKVSNVAILNLFWSYPHDFTQTLF